MGKLLIFGDEKRKIFKKNSKRNVPSKCVQTIGKIKMKIDCQRIFYLCKANCKEQHSIFVSSENSNGRMQCLWFHIVLLAIVISFSLTHYCLEAITSLPNRKQENSNIISVIFTRSILLLAMVTIIEVILKNSSSEGNEWRKNYSMCTTVTLPHILSPKYRFKVQRYIGRIQKNICYYGKSANKFRQ